MKIDIYYESDVGCCADIDGNQKIEGCKDEVEVLETIVKFINEGLLDVREGA